MRDRLSRLVLLRLLVAGGRPVPVARLATDVGLPLPGGAGRLFGAIAALRRQQERGRQEERARTPGPAGRHLVTTAAGYALVDGSGPPATPATDDREAADLLTAARAAVAAGRLASAGEQAAAALALWRGPALPEAGDAPWAQAERARLDQLRASLQVVMAAVLVVTDPSAAPDVLDQARAEHPDDERLWALAAAAELALEHDVAALRVLRRARLALEAGGGGRGPALRAMEAAVLAGDHGQTRLLVLRLASEPPDPPVLVTHSAAGDGLGDTNAACPVDGVMLGSTVRRRASCLPARSRRLLELLAAAPSAGPSVGPSATLFDAPYDGGPGDRPEPGLDLVLLGRAAGLSPAAVAEHLDPAVALGLVAVGPGVVRLWPAGAGPALLAGLSPFQLRATRRLVAQARLGDRPRRHRHQG